MKSLSLVLAGVLSFAVLTPSFAQVHFGAVAGINFATVKLDPEDTNLASRTGFAIGGVVTLPLGDKLILQAEPMYLQKGATSDEPGDDVTIELDFLEIPVLLKFPFGDNDLQPYVVAGPSVGLNLTAKFTGTSDGFNIDEDIKDEIKSVDFGLTVGGGVTKPAGNNSLFGEVRYTVGLSDINDDPNAGGDSIKTNGLQIILGILFGTD